MARYTQRLKMPRMALYHLISRVVHREHLLTDAAKDALRHIMRSQAAFCGIEVLTYCLLSNHFHILARVDPREAEGVDDASLVERFRALYGKKRSAALGMDAERLAEVLAMEGAAAHEIRRKLKARMGNASIFMKELKARFTFWYNEHTGAAGTFWAEKFRSVVVEPNSLAARMVAAYIDLNAVRAGIVDDPKDYAWCGYGEAAAGGALACRGLALVEGALEPTRERLARYRLRLVKQMGGKAETGEEGIPVDAAVSLMRRVRGLCEGLAVGSLAWVKDFSRRGGLIGYLRDNEPKILAEGEGGGDTVAAARQWLRAKAN